MIFLLINRYQCPNTKSTFIQAHEVDKETLQIVKSFSKMLETDLPLFAKYDQVVLIDVARSKQLAQFNLITINK